MTGRQLQPRWALAALLPLLSSACQPAPAPAEAPTPPAEASARVSPGGQASTRPLYSRPIAALLPPWANFTCGEDLGEGPLWACEAADALSCDSGATVRHFKRGRMLRREQEVDVFLLECSTRTFIGYSAPGTEALGELRTLEGERAKLVFVRGAGAVLERLVVVTNGEGEGQRWGRIENVRLTEGQEPELVFVPYKLRDNCGVRSTSVVTKGLDVILEAHLSCEAGGATHPLGLDISLAPYATPREGAPTATHPSPAASAEWTRISLSDASFSLLGGEFSFGDAALEEHLDTFLREHGGLGVPKITASGATSGARLKALGRLLGRYDVTRASLEIDGAVREVRFHVPYLDPSFDERLERAPRKLVVSPTAAYALSNAPWQSGLESGLWRLTDKDRQEPFGQCRTETPTTPIVIALDDRAPLSALGTWLGSCEGEEFALETRPLRAPSTRHGAPRLRLEPTGIHTVGRVTIGEIHAALQAKAPMLLDCYRRGLTLDPEARGTLEIAFETSTEGETTDARLSAGSNLYSAPIEQCVEQLFRSISYAVPQAREPRAVAAAVQLHLFREQ